MSRLLGVALVSLLFYVLFRIDLSLSIVNPHGSIDHIGFVDYGALGSYWLEWSHELSGLWTLLTNYPSSPMYPINIMGSLL